MSKKTATTGSLTYRELISQSSEQIAAEQLDSNVEQANISFKQGLLSMESKLISAKSNVSSKESSVKSAENAIVAAKRKAPSCLVQSIIDAKVNMLQAEENLKAAREEQEKLQSLYDYLLEVQKELF